MLCKIVDIQVGVSVCESYEPKHQYNSILLRTLVPSLVTNCTYTCHYKSSIPLNQMLTCYLSSAQNPYNLLLTFKCKKCKYSFH